MAGSSFFSATLEAVHGKRDVVAYKVQRRSIASPGEGWQPLDEGNKRKAVRVDLRFEAPKVCQGRNGVTESEDQREVRHKCETGGKRVVRMLVEIIGTFYARGGSGSAAFCLDTARGGGCG